MPSRLDIEFATPLCDRRILKSKGVQKRPSQQAVHVTCYSPMRWDETAEAWVCQNPECAAVDLASDVVARVFLRRAAAA